LGGVVVQDNHEAIVEVTAVGGAANVPTLMAKPVNKPIDWWMVLWLSGVVVCASPLAAGWWRTRGLVRRAEVVGADEELSRLAERIYAGMNNRCRWSILLSDETLMPLTGGWFRPFVVLPSGAREWSELRQWRVFTHEIGHQVRHDFVWILFARMVCALCWFNPLAWYAVNRQRIEAEMACDDLVISAGDVAEDYADDLLQILRDFSQGLDTPFVSLMARQSQIKARLRSMLNRVANRQPLGNFGKWGFVVSVLFLVSALAMVRLVHATGTKTNSNKQTSLLEADVQNKQVEISSKFYKISKKMVSQELSEFSKGWIENDREKVIGKLEKAGGVVLSEPKITLFSGQKAKLRMLGELRRTDDWDAQDKIQNTAATVYVQPEIVSKKQIELKLKLESVIFTGFVHAQNARDEKDLTPIFDSRSIETNFPIQADASVLLWMPEDKRMDDQTGVILTVRLVDAVEIPQRTTGEKLNSIVIPQCDFKDASVGDVLLYLQNQSQLNDPYKEGINIVFKEKPSEVDVGHPWQGGGKVTMSLTGMTVGKVLDLVMAMSVYKYKVEEHCVYVYPASEINWVMLVRTYPLTAKLSEIIGRIDGDAVQDVVKPISEAGIEFPKGSKAKYLPKSKKLVVRNTQEQLEKIEKLLKE
jgi:beta-lactamase regulating signal transducer with metallopeptidase domain